MDSIRLISIVFSLIFLLGAFFLSILASAIVTYSKIHKELTHKSSLWDMPIVGCLKIFKPQKIENLYHITQLTKHLSVILYSITLYLLLNDLKIDLYLSFVIIILTSLITNFLAKTIAFHFKPKIVYLSSLLASFYIFTFYPISFVFTKIIFNKSLKKSNFDSLVDIFYGKDIKKIIDPKILSSLITFREKSVREVMIPRVKVFSLPTNITIKEAAKAIINYNFSRIPIYKDKTDNIIGVLMYKDVLKIYTQIDLDEKKEIFNSPIEILVKPVIYVPENKKISHLFQEFRSKQRHLAIVVNEYGGAEGIITIEDILEELVGEIEDEYDINEERQFWQLPDGSWIVDSKMSIIDIDKKLNILIPHSPEYETIGGFIFHKAGTIPKKGWILQLDEFELEVLISNDRCLEKIKITPFASKTPEERV